MEKEIKEEKIKKLKKFPPESVGSLMISRVPTVLMDSQVGEIESLLLKETKNLENINYIYVLDREGKLKGVVSIKELFITPKDVLVQNVMKTNITTVRPRADRERAAVLAIKNNIKNVPVVDKEGLFLGVVPSDVILDILHQEHIEDMLRSEGILRHTPIKEFFYADAISHFKKRLPWLLVGLFGGLGAAGVVGLFNGILSQMIVLAAFIPSVVYIADAVGSQTQTIFIRSLAFDQNVNLRSYIKRESAVGFLLALFLSILAGLLVLWWWRSPLVSLVITLSFFATIITSAVSGVFLPWIFYKINLDPAVTSGPFSTVIRDILSVLIYFSVAFLVLGALM